MSGFPPGAPTQGRLELASIAARMRADGAKLKEIAAELRCSTQYASELLHDPDGAKARARKASYRGVCEKCGGPTAGCNGRAQAPKLCDRCHRDSIRAPHGTRSRYVSGCSCDDCRRANREYGRMLKGKPVPNHGHSGYRNYGCRCDICKRAHSDYLWRTNNSRRYPRKKAAA